LARLEQADDRVEILGEVGPTYRPIAILEVLKKRLTLT